MEKKCLRPFSAIVEAQFQLAKAYHKLAEKSKEEKLRRERFLKANELYQSITSRRTDHQSAWVEWGKLLDLMGEGDPEKKFLNVLSISPKNTSALFALSDYYLRKGSHKVSVENSFEEGMILLKKCEERLGQILSLEDHKLLAEANFLFAELCIFYAGLPKKFGEVEGKQERREKCRELFFKAAKSLNVALELSPSLLSKLWSLFPMDTEKLVDLATLISSGCTKIVIQVRKQIRSIESVKCSKKEFLSEEAEKRFFSDLLRSCSKLRVLDLSHMKVRAASAPLLLEAIKNNSSTLEKVLFPAVHTSSSSGWKKFFNEFPLLSSICEVSLESNLVEDRAIDVFSKFSSLTSFDVCFFTFFLFAFLKPHSNFQISGTNVTTEGLKKLSKLKLRKLRLSKLKIDHKEVCELLERIPTIEFLDISHNNLLNLFSLNQILQSGSRLTFLSVFNCTQISLPQMFQISSPNCFLLAPEGQNFEFAVKTLKVSIEVPSSSLFSFNIGKTYFEASTAVTQNGMRATFTMRVLEDRFGLARLPYFVISKINSSVQLTVGNLEVFKFSRTLNSSFQNRLITAFGKNIVLVANMEDDCWNVIAKEKGEEGETPMASLRKTKDQYQFVFEKGVSIPLALAILFVGYFTEEKNF